MERLSGKQVDEIRTVSEIYPFKTNNYVLENLIDWNNIPDDPIFRLNFPHREMLIEEHFDKIEWGKGRLSAEKYAELIREIRLSLNPHPAGQTYLNMPMDEEGNRLNGIQHKYESTLLFFPSHGQTCHAYCTFCFRWPQFINDLELKIQAKEIGPLINYLNRNKQVTDILITGGDPMVMSAKILSSYIDPLIELDSIRSIRIGSKSLSYWPHKFVSDPDGEGILELFRKVVRSGKHLAFMAHFNHPAELATATVREAIFNIRQTGAEIRTQAPLLKNINNRPEIWSSMWRAQVELGCIPYYMFLPRDTGAQHYFAQTLDDALDIYRGAIQKISGLCRTARGPVMSMTSGKMELLDIEDGVYSLRYLQHRKPDMTYKVFKTRAKVNNPKWFDDLESYGEAYDPYFDTSIAGGEYTAEAGAMEGFMATP
jgi:L-lysine 2,3-aminomutase